MTEKERVESHAFYVFLGLISLALVYVSWEFALPVLWAVLAAIMFQPMFRWFLAKPYMGPNRAVFATLLVITFAIVIPGALIGSAIVDQAAGVVLSFQDGTIDFTGWLGGILDGLPPNIQSWLDSKGFGQVADIQLRAQELAEESLGLIAQQAVEIGGSLLNFLLALGVAFYASVFLIRDGRQIANIIERTLPFEPAVSQRLSARFTSIVRATIKGSVVVGIVQGALGAITFWIVGLPSALLLGLLMALASLIPAVGTGLIWVPTAIYLLATGQIWQGLVVIISGVAVIGMADNILRPVLVGRDTGIPDWVILITTLGGLSIFGLSGIVIGPLVAGLFMAGWNILREQRESDALDEEEDDTVPLPDAKPESA